MSKEIDGIKREWWFDGSTAVIGKYNSRNCCGVDASHYTAEGLIRAIKAISAQEKPNAIIFEEVRLGGLYSFKTRLRKEIENIGGEYMLVTLIASFETMAKRVVKRTGNENVNFDAMRSKGASAIRSSRKAQEDGVRVVWIDTDQYNPDQAYYILRRTIDG